MISKVKNTYYHTQLNRDRLMHDTCNNVSYTTLIDHSLFMNFVFSRTIIAVIYGPSYTATFGMCTFILKDRPLRIYRPAIWAKEQFNILVIRIPLQHVNMRSRGEAYKSQVFLKNSVRHCLSPFLVSTLKHNLLAIICQEWRVL